MQDSIRYRFSSALQWYASLVNCTNQYVQQKIDDEREKVSVLESPPEPPPGKLNLSYPIIITDVTILSLASSPIPDHSDSGGESDSDSKSSLGRYNN